jgi:hypothetical protein
LTEYLDIFFIVHKMDEPPAMDSKRLCRWCTPNLVLIFRPRTFRRHSCRRTASSAADWRMSTISMIYNSSDLLEYCGWKFLKKANY